MCEHRDCRRAPRVAGTLDTRISWSARRHRRYAVGLLIRWKQDMKEFVLVYVGGNPPATPEEGQAHFQKYMAWLNDLGDAAVSPANPLMNTKTVGPDGAISDNGSTGISGYTIVSAESMDAALAIAQSCPFLAIGGSLEVSERGQMPG